MCFYDTSSYGEWSYGLTDNNVLSCNQKAKIMRIGNKVLTKKQVLEIWYKISGKYVDLKVFAFL